jgi:hypothetical protein
MARVRKPLRLSVAHQCARVVDGTDLRFETMEHGGE